MTKTNEDAQQNALEDQWDEQIQRDADSGRLDALMSRAEADIKAGHIKPLDQILSGVDQQVNQLTVHLPAGISIQEARFLLAAKLYETDRLSLGQAAELSEHSKATFMELLGKYGISVFDQSPKTLEHEMML